MQITNDQGEELWKTTTVIIAPILYIDASRQIASKYLETIEKVVDFQIEKMLTTPIGNDGQITHYICERTVLNTEADSMVEWIGNQEYEWCANRYYTFNDDYLSMYCVVETTLDELLMHSGKIKL